MEFSMRWLLFDVHVHTVIKCLSTHTHTYKKNANNTWVRSILSDKQWRYKHSKMRYEMAVKAFHSQSKNGVLLFSMSRCGTKRDNLSETEREWTGRDKESEEKDGQKVVTKHQKQVTQRNIAKRDKRMNGWRRMKYIKQKHLLLEFS